MGKPKALLEFGGVPLLTHVAAALVQACDEVVLSVAPVTEAPQAFVDSCCEAIRRAGKEVSQVVRDRHPHRGPAEGLALSLEAARGEFAFVSGCDSPLLAPALVRGLLSCARTEAPTDAVIPIHEGRKEPLLAVYRVASMADHFARKLAREHEPLTAGLEEVRVVEVSESALSKLDPRGLSFLNVNTPADYERALLARAKLSTRFQGSSRP